MTHVPYFIGLLSASFCKRCEPAVIAITPVENGMEVTAPAILPLSWLFR